jgi:phosphate transport system substrate-binding protein
MAAVQDRIALAAAAFEGVKLQLKRFGAALSILSAGVLIMSACGTDKNSAGGSATGTSGATPSANAACGGKQALKASGSTAQANAMTRFVKAYEQACPGQTLNYTGNGSGDGIREFNGKQTDFGGSDSPLTPAEYAAAQQRCGSPAWNLPVVFGPVAVAYNVNGLTSLVLDGPTVARIFNGGITVWNDAAIAGLNPGVTLPAEPIRVVYRSDDSGTSDNFQKYLDTAGNGAWGKGVGKKFKGGVGEGAAHNDGVAGAIKGAEGSIGYVELSFAQAQQLGTAKIITSAGPEPVAVSSDTAAKTIAAAVFLNGENNDKKNDLVLDTIGFYRPSQPGSYPIVLATYEIVCSKNPDAAVGAAVKAFLQITIGAGQNGLADNGYVPLPDVFKARLSSAVNALS